MLQAKLSHRMKTKNYSTQTKEENEYRQERMKMVVPLEIAVALGWHMGVAIKDEGCSMCISTLVFPD
jgi:hypothetical protein